MDSLFRLSTSNRWPYSVNVVAQNAVPEAHPWVLLMAGLASVFLISSRRIRG